MSIHIYLKSRSTCEEALMVRHHIAIVAQTVDLV